MSWSRRDARHTKQVGKNCFISFRPRLLYVGEIGLRVGPLSLSLRTRPERNPREKMAARDPGGREARKKRVASRPQDLARPVFSSGFVSGLA